MESKLTYFDGIIEGRLIENGFHSIGKSLFYNRIGGVAFVVRHSEGNKCVLEVYSDLPSTIGETDAVVYVETLRDNAFEELCVSGDIHDILQVYRMYKIYREI
ncbi:hypothetical protein SAMN05444162_0150 [Paenibacillaceae bacterium GAS479]|nr:hypothetical protein SAMN05444162_0150 [Paenibacillaceae bacterium GAS479]